MGRSIDPSLETELLRRYLNKDHAFRTNEWDVRRRGLLDARYIPTWSDVSVGWRNLTALFGEQVDGQLEDLGHTGVQFNWRDHADDPQNSYLWGFGTNRGDYWRSGVPAYIDALGNDLTWEAGIMDSEFLSHTPSHVVFSEHFGSYSADWARSDGLLRSHLANSGYGLAATWGAKNGELFSYYLMGNGSPIGESLLTTQNQGGDLTSHSLTTPPANPYIYSSIVGDPTLRLHSVAPPTEVIADAHSGGGVDIGWTASTDDVLTYRIYRAPVNGEEFELIATTPATAATSYYDASGSLASHRYMVRAMNRETGPSGSYYNLSVGAFSDGIQFVGAINTGGGTEVSLGKTFAADSQGSSTTHAIDLALASVPLGVNEDLFEDARIGASSWDFSGLASGRYAVRLYFAEFDAAIDQIGKRTFDVALESVNHLDEFDIVAVAGGQYRGVVKTFVLNVTDGNLDIDLTDGDNALISTDPLISAIEVYHF